MVQGESTGMTAVAPKPGVGSSYKHGWTYLWKHFGILLLIGIIYVVLSYIIQIPQFFMNLGSGYDLESLGTLFAGSAALSFIGILYAIFFLNPVAYGQTYAYLRAARDDKVEVKDMFASFGNYWNVVGASILYGLIVGVGPGILLAIILFIILGVTFAGASASAIYVGAILIVLVIVLIIFLACKLAFVPFIVVDRKTGGVEAIRQSWRMTKGYGWKVFLLYLLGIPIVIAGLICLVIGVIISIMWINIALASLYYSVDASRETTMELPLAGTG